MPINKRTESQVLKSCIQYLSKHGYYTIRMNTGLIKTESGSYFKQGVCGMADILALYPGTSDEEDDLQTHYIYWIECKSSSKSAKQRPAQMYFQKNVESRGHKYLLVNDVQQLIEAGL